MRGFRHERRDCQRRVRRNGTIASRAVETLPGDPLASIEAAKDIVNDRWKRINREYKAYRQAEEAGGRRATAYQIWLKETYGLDRRDQ